MRPYNILLAMILIVILGSTAPTGYVVIDEACMTSVDTDVGVTALESYTISKCETSELEIILSPVVPYAVTAKVQALPEQPVAACNFIKERPAIMPRPPDIDMHKLGSLTCMNKLLI